MLMDRGSRETTADSASSVASSSASAAPRARTTRAQANDDEDDVRSVASSEDINFVQKLPKYKRERIRRYYVPESNLLDAFETATATDLSHNLFGFALEKRKRTRASQDNVSEWSSKTRLVDDDTSARLRTSYGWAAWPCNLEEHRRLAGVESGNKSKVQAATQQLETTGSVLQDVLAGVAMSFAREAKSTSAKPTKMQVSDGAVKESPLPPDGLVFSADEDKSIRLLKPITAKALKKIEDLFTQLMPTRRQDQVNLVDWKNVLESVLDLGWDDRVIAATRERCSAMFGEGFSRDLSSEHEQSLSQPRNDGSSPEVDRGSLQPQILAGDEDDVGYEM